MNIICSSCGIVYWESPKQGIQDIAQAGFSNMTLDLGMFCSPYFLENEGNKWMNDPFGPQVAADPKALSALSEPMMQMAREKKLSFRMGTATCLPEDSEREERLELLGRILEESIRVCGAAGCPQLLVQPIFFGDSEGEVLEKTKDFYLKLVSEAKKNRVMLLFGNRVKNYNGNFMRGLFSDGRKAAEWIDGLNSAAGEECFGFYMDVALCSLCGLNMYDFIAELGHRIKVVALSDCSGSNPAHLLPFSGARGCESQTDWLNLVRGLRSIGYDNDLLIEFTDTVLAFSTLLRPQVMQLAKATAEFLKWQVEIENVLRKYPSRVLFGAGNMCRNYMKCYGEKYPPFFTCDNNESKWGTTFCGLTIEPPEKLKEIPEDAVIFICNVYYREIEQQLRKMGVKNPVEYFNDEYMPSFHFDRVEDIMERNSRKGETANENRGTE